MDFNEQLIELIRDGPCRCNLRLAVLQRHNSTVDGKKLACALGKLVRYFKAEVLLYFQWK